MNEALPVSKRRTLPIKKIARLIELAQKYDLEEFQVGDIRIKCREKFQEAAPRKRATNLSQRQQEDLVLFGIDGVTNERQ